MIRKKYFEVVIVKTARNHLRQELYTFDSERVRFKSIAEVKEFLKDKYGRIPHRKNKIYVDNEEGNPQEVGFTYSFWDRDISHNSKAWYQTDWITIEKVEEKREGISI